MLAPARFLVPAFAFALVTSTALSAQDEKKDRATKDDYKIEVSGSTAELAVGADGVIQVVLVPKNGTKIHPQAPLEVKLSEPEGLKLHKRKLSRGDVADKEAKSPALSTKVTAQKAGAHKVNADVSFFLCTDEWCQRMTDRVAIPVKVQ